MVNSYNHANQYVKLKGRQIDKGKGVARIFRLSHEGVVPIGRESYKPIVATCFIGDEHEHHIARGDHCNKRAISSTTREGVVNAT